MMQLIGVLIAAAACVATLYALMRPHWTFVLLMVMFPLKQLLQVYVPFIAARPTLVNYAIGLVVLAAVATRFARREQIGKTYLNRVTVMVLLLYALWWVGLLYTPVRELVTERIWTDLTYMALLLVFMPLLVLDIFEFRRALYGMMIVGSIICVLIMINPSSSFTSGRLVLDLGMLATGRDTGNPLATASLGAMTALVAALIRPARATTMVTALRVGAFIAGMGMAIGSGSRGQVLAAGVVGVIFFPLSRKLANPKQFLIVATGFMALVAGLYAVFRLFVSDQNVARWDPIGMLVDSTQRLEMVQNLMTHYLASPAHWLFGLGTGAYAGITTDRSEGRNYVHNMPAEVLGEHGIVGFILLIAMVIFLLRYGRSLWVMFRDDPAMRATVALLCAICMFSFLESLKQGAMHFPTPFYWWIILAKLAAHEEKIMQESADAQNEEQAYADDDEYAEAFDGEPAHA